jgi:hypothetical protein
MAGDIPLFHQCVQCGREISAKDKKLPLWRTAFILDTWYDVCPKCNPGTAQTRGVFLERLNYLMSALRLRIQAGISHWVDDGGSHQNPNGPPTLNG